MHRTAKPLVYRLNEISELDLGKLLAVFSLPGSIAYSIVLIHGYERVSFPKGLAIVVTAVLAIALAAFVGGLILAAIYNVLARFTGGVRLRLSLVERGEAAGPGAAGTKRCPQCQAEVRSDLSFCPECDHVFHKQP